MKNKIRNIWAVFSFDFEATFGFGFLEAVAAFILYLSLSMVNSLLAGVSFGVRVPLDPPWTEAYEHYVELFARTATLAYAHSTFGLTSILAFALPIVVMFSIAKGFEDGFLQTQLTYPIGRTKLLLIKVFATLCIFGMLSSICAHLAVSFFCPGKPQVENVLLIMGAFWAFLFLVITSTALLALLLKRPLVGSLIGASFWLGIGIMRVLPDSLAPLENVLNPLIPVSDFINPYSVTDYLFCNLVLYVIGTLAIALSFLMMAIVYFNQLDV